MDYCGLRSESFNEDHVKMSIFRVALRGFVGWTLTIHRLPSVVFRVACRVFVGWTLTIPRRSRVQTAVCGIRA
jgi:hypothetical protein